MSEHNTGLFSTQESIFVVKEKAMNAIAELDMRKADRKKKEEESSKRWAEWKAKSWWYRLTHTYDAPEYDPFAGGAERKMRNLLVDAVHMITLNPQEITLTADTCWHIEYLSECFKERKKSESDESK